MQESCSPLCVCCCCFQVVPTALIMQALRGSNGSFEAPGVVPVRVDTPPLEELEGGWAEQGAVGGDGQEQVLTQAVQLPQGECRACDMTVT